MRLTTSIPRQGTRPRYRRSLIWLMLRGQAMHPTIAQRFSAMTPTGLAAKKDDAAQHRDKTPILVRSNRVGNRYWMVAPSLFSTRSLDAIDKIMDDRTLAKAERCA